LLAKNTRLLREYARQYLGDGATDDDVEDAIERTTDALLDAEFAPHPHGLRLATQQLWRDCQRAIQRRRQPTVEAVSLSSEPVDRRLGRPLTRYVLDRLGPLSRLRILRAAEGWTPEQQATAENKPVDTIHIGLHRARQRALQLFEESSAGAVVAVVGRRLRSGGYRVAMWCQRQANACYNALGTDPVGQLGTVAVLAVTSLTTATPALEAIPASPLPVALRAAPVRPHVGPAAVDAWTGPVARAFHPAAAATATQEPSGADGPLQNATPRLLSRALPADETPEDTQLMTAAAGPNYETTHTIVALGMGNSCGCAVLFQSTDGGATWTPSTSAAPPGAEQLELPPTYPTDPRVFIGTNPQSAQSAYVMPHFGDTPMPLPGPAGHLALSARFDSGDDRVFVAAQGAVVSITVDGSLQHVTPLLTYPESLTSTAIVATPAPSDGAAVIVLAPSGTVIVGDPLAGESQTSTLIACGTGTSCASRGAPPAQPLFSLTVSRSDTTSAVSSQSEVSVSSDGGKTFTAATEPSSGAVVESLTTTEGRVWVSVTRGSTAAVLWSADGGATWHNVTAAGDGLTRTLRLVAIPKGPVLDFLVGRGLRCSADAGLTWQSRCP
jgi:DNA-directed RNA polymerase specialized sigma24 family protein